MDKIKKLVLFRIPMSICNFSCHYCYLSQRPVHFQGIQPEMKYTPEQVAYAMRKERLGGTAYINLCADGETLLVKNIEKYARLLAQEGHYIEIVSNMTVTPVLDQILTWPKELLKHLEFKCSFHYLELKKRNKLDLFAENIKKVWAAGGSANVEITPSDELIPYINEVKEFSLHHFGALPHITIARDDRTDGIDYLTSLSMEEYDNTWRQFGSSFWEFKKTIFGKYQNGFCMAGSWSVYVDFYSGDARQCYCGRIIGNIYDYPEKPFPESPIGKCEIPHCYNGYMFLTLGLIAGHNDVRYGDIRDRVKSDGSHWLQPELLAFFNSKLEESNKVPSQISKATTSILNKLSVANRKSCNLLNRIKNRI